MSLPHGSVLVMLLPRDPRRFKMTVHFSLRAATHRHTHTRLLRSGSRLVHQPVSLHPSLVLVMLCVCVCESRVEQRSYSDSDNEDGDGNEDGADGLKHMTAIRSPTKTSELCGFCADP